MRRVLAGLLALALAGGCDIALDISTPSAPTAPGGPSITNTNTNTSTNNNDRADTQATAPGSGGGTGGDVALPLPAYGESVVRAVAADNPALLANSCQLTTGESAWAFLDLVIRTLQARDARWGYLCKDAGCTTFGRDVVTYKATSTDVGIFIVDVIGNHCPDPGDVVAVRWGVLPYEIGRRWSGTRR